MQTRLTFLINESVQFTCILSEYVKQFYYKMAITANELEYLQQNNNIHCFSKPDFKKFKDELDCNETDNCFYYDDNYHLKMIKMTNITGTTSKFPNKLFIESNKIQGGYFILPLNKRDEILKRIHNTSLFHVIGTSGRSEYHLGIAQKSRDCIATLQLNNKEETVCKFDMINSYNDHLLNNETQQAPIYFRPQY